MRINIVIAEGRKLFRESLSLLLEKHADLHVIAEAATAAEAAKLVSALPAQVVVLNLTPFADTAAAMLRAILRANPQTRIVVLSNSDDGSWIRRLLEAGASGCLSRQSAGDELVRAIRAVHMGHTYLSPDMIHQVVSRYRQPGTTAQSARKPLAPREQEILRRIAEGQATKEIAAALRIGPKTVETHRRRMMRKLHISTVAELTKHALREGLVSLDKGE
jgi:DNA-binding NarL/FixJ family response regulator